MKHSQQILSGAGDVAAIIGNLENLIQKFPEHAVGFQLAKDRLEATLGLLDTEFGRAYRHEHWEHGTP